ncbi:hypothetical protein [Trichothermofontia sp.]
MRDMDRDLLVIALYIISVILVLSIKNPLKVSFEKNLFKESIEKINLNVGIDFQLKPQYQSSEKLSMLVITIENKSTEEAIRIDWDKSSFVDIYGKVHRIVRSPPGLEPDANKTPNVSLIPPTKKYPANLVTEDIVKKEGAPLVDLSELKHEGFPYRFSLWLFTEVFNVQLADSKSKVCILDCQFKISEIPFQLSDIFKLPKL